VALSGVWSVLFAGCKPEVAAFDGRIIAVGAGARVAAGRGAEVVRLRGVAWPGLIDSHIHLEGLADRKVSLDLTGAASLAETSRRVKDWAKKLSRSAWVVGSGWYNDAWPDPTFPNREHLDRVVGGRPAFLRRKDGHSAWVSSEALRIAGIEPATQDPPGGSIDRDGRGEPTGILRETAMQLVWPRVPAPSVADFDKAMARVLAELAKLGLTSVHSMDSSRGLGSFQRLASRGSLPVRVTYKPTWPTPSAWACAPAGASHRFGSGASKHSSTGRSAAGPRRCWTAAEPYACLNRSSRR
jgi:predicted amidohydrolase YtcJ